MRASHVIHVAGVSDNMNLDDVVEAFWSKPDLAVFGRTRNHVVVGKLIRSTLCSMLRMCS